MDRIQRFRTFTNSTNQILFSCCVGDVYGQIRNASNDDTADLFALRLSYSFNETASAGVREYILLKAAANSTVFYRNSEEPSPESIHFKFQF